MLTKAVRLYGKSELRLESFELPQMGEDEILAKVVSDSLCMSSYKAAKQGADHKRVPDDVAEHPTIIGHEFSGEILEVGRKWRGKFKPGQKFSIQPALNYRGSLDAPGYSFQYIGGNATHVLIPNEVMECDCLLGYEGEGYFPASLSEPMSCIIGAFNASYHTTGGSYVHDMGIKQGGKAAILAGVGPMGLGAIDYAINRDRRPSLLVVTDIDTARLERAKSLYPPAMAKEKGIELVFINTAEVANPAAVLKEVSGGDGYDDVFVFAPVQAVIELGDDILGKDGCLNFFAGPTKSDFKANFNFYNVHYASTHIVGTSGGNTDDMRESLALMAAGRINPAAMVTHIGGLDCVVEATLNLPSIPGGKKLIYNHINMDLTAIADFAAKAADDGRFRELAEITGRNNGLWSLEAESYLLENF